MKKKWNICVAGMAILLLFAAVIRNPVDVFAQSETDAELYMESASGVYDDAKLLTDSEEESLQELIVQIRETTGWELFIVTTEDAGGKSAREYADDFYDARTTEDSDGLAALIDMDNREIYISTYGEAIRYLDDERIENILDDAYEYVSEGLYMNCCAVMLSGAEKYYYEGIPEDQYNYDVETGAVSHYRSLTWMEVLPVVLLAVGAGAAVYLIVLRRYRVKGKRHPYEYYRFGKVDLTDCEDRFVRQNVIHQRIQTDTGGSGRSGHGGSSHRSTVHRSSSGRSHGGGGRKF